MDRMEHFPVGIAVIVVSGIMVSALPNRWSDVKHLATTGAIALLYYLAWEDVRNSAGLIELIFVVGYAAPMIGISKIGDFMVSFPWF